MMDMRGACELHELTRAVYLFIDTMWFHTNTDSTGIATATITALNARRHGEGTAMVALYASSCGKAAVHNRTDGESNVGSGIAPLGLRLRDNALLVPNRAARDSATDGSAVAGVDGSDCDDDDDDDAEESAGRKKSEGVVI